MKTKVLLINPEFPVTYWSFKYALTFVGNKARFPPLGLITIAAILPDHYELKLLDMNVRDIREEEILWSDMVFISAMLVQKESFERGSAKARYMDETRPDITRTPNPRLELREPNTHFSMMHQFSRGCPFNREFCDIIEMFGRKPRTKSPGLFIAEIDAPYATGYRGSLFEVDDNFIGNKKIVKELLPLIAAWQKEHGYLYSLFTETSVNLADDGELMDTCSGASWKFPWASCSGWQSPFITSSSSPPTSITSKRGPGSSATKRSRCTHPER